MPGTGHVLTHSFFTTLHKAGALIIPILGMRRLRHRVEVIRQRPDSCKWQSQHLNCLSPSLISSLLSSCSTQITFFFFLSLLCVRHCIKWSSWVNYSSLRSSLFSHFSNEENEAQANCSGFKTWSGLTPKLVLFPLYCTGKDGMAFWRCLVTLREKSMFCGNPINQVLT